MFRNGFGFYLFIENHWAYLTNEKMYLSNTYNKLVEDAVRGSRSYDNTRTACIIYLRIHSATTQHTNVVRYRYCYAKLFGRNLFQNILRTHSWYAYTHMHMIVSPENLLFASGTVLMKTRTIYPCNTLQLGNPRGTTGCTTCNTHNILTCIRLMFY